MAGECIGVYGQQQPWVLEDALTYGLHLVVEETQVLVEEEAEAKISHDPKSRSARQIELLCETSEEVMKKHHEEVMRQSTSASGASLFTVSRRNLHPKSECVGKGNTRCWLGPPRKTCNSGEVCNNRSMQR